MQILIDNTKEPWNNNLLTLVERPSSMGDAVLVCIHKEHQDPSSAITVLVYKTDLMRAAAMIGVPFAKCEPRND